MGKWKSAGLILLILLLMEASCLLLEKTLYVEPNAEQTPPGHWTPVATPIVNSFSSRREVEDYVTSSMILSRIMPWFIPETFHALKYGAMLPVLEESTAVLSTEKPEHSVTNVQVEGVDEADIVKTDGEYIYVARGSSVVIVKAYPPSEVSIVHKLNFTGMVEGIFVEGDRLVVIVASPSIFAVSLLRNVQGKTNVYQVIKEFPETSILLYNITNIFNPILMNNITVTGSYATSRLSGKYCYTIITQPSIAENGTVILPEINGVEVEASDVKYFTRDFTYVFTTIISLNVENGSYGKDVFLTGCSSNIYMSHENLYLFSRKRVDPYRLMERVVEALLENAPDALRNKVNDLMNSREYDVEGLVEVEKAVEDYINSLSSEEKNRVLNKVYNEFYGLYVDETTIYRFALNGTSIKASAIGTIPGHILDQFSIDEYNGYLRVATTVSKNLSGGSESINNVYVLNMDLQIVGCIENLALGERIYAARFMGNKMFLVTFRRIDPLFAIDLSDPENPRVLGELKILGYSEYLHPYLEDYLIGVGVEVDEKGLMHGLKIALFNISDIENPILVSNITIGDRMSWTPILTDHKAFTINIGKNYMCIPVYGEIDGVYVVNVSIEALALRGFISHQGAIRTLYIGDYIYTISNNMIKVVNDSSLEVVHKVFLN